MTGIWEITVLFVKIWLGLAGLAAALAIVLGFIYLALYIKRGMPDE